jgi:hypothetical protein
MMTEILSPCDSLPDLARAIQREHDAVRTCVAEGLEHARRAGELLRQAKAALPHGDWLPWLEKHCDVSARTAQAYMRIADRWQTLEAAKAQRVADLPLREALALLAEPRPVVDGEADDPVVAARWTLWEDTWRTRTGEDPPPRPLELWRDMVDWLGMSDLAMPEVNTLRDWHADCVMHIFAWPVLLRTGACPPSPPSWSFETRARRWHAEKNRELTWELFVQREAGQYFNRCDSLGALDRQNNIQSEWTANVAAARTLLRELGGAELADAWTDEEAATWARGYVYAPWYWTAIDIAALLEGSET